MRRLAWLLLLAACNGPADEDKKAVEPSQPPPPRHSNRLIHEKSPYLLQHAHNPVDWYPWGPEAFDRARKEDKPIFLSIGYSTCHWCHVMERESFEDEEIAKLMNEAFVCIKVDREERPDIDAVYMTACQAFGQPGGWPLTAILTPDGKPFFMGTYFPPTAKFGRPGMKELIPHIVKVWKESRDKVVESARALADAVKSAAAAREPGELTREVLDRAVEQFKSMFDPVYGGFEGAPKFPRTHTLSFLLGQYVKSKDAEILRQVEKTLDAMASGGIFDHLGYGFHRYSTDRLWLVPHFEKMLYDQAIIARTYLQAHQVTGKERYAQVARRIFEYVLRDMTDREGGFYSAEDADSEGEEGKFYVWTKKEIERELGAELAGKFCRAYDVSDEGNWEGVSILQVVGPTDGLDEARKRLFEIREKRIHPHKDDKILTDWNGLMIGALAYGAQALDDPAYARAAARAADFVLTKMRRPDGRLLKSYRKGASSVPGYLEDYAFFVAGLLDLYEATFEPRWLKTAMELNGDMVRLFWSDRGGFVLSDSNELISKTIEIYDGAIPSGNSMAALNLIRLAELTFDETHRQLAARLFKAVGGDVKRGPAAYPQLLIAYDFLLGPAKEIVLAGDPKDAGVRAMARAVRRRFIPNRAVLLQAGELEWLADYSMKDGKATAFVCTNRVCNLPTTDLGVLEDQLK